MVQAVHPGVAGPSSRIHWRQWGRAAFDEAVRHDRPVLLHLTGAWSYDSRRMAETTFADPLRAGRIEADFVPVRADVDRLPHVQERYIAGGWPTNAFLTPTGEVLWAGTYVEAEEFDQVASGVLEAWKGRRAELRLEVERRHKAADAARSRQTSMALVRREAAADVLSRARRSFDAHHGGFGEAPKFPYPDAIDLLLVEAAITRDAGFVQMAEQTLDGILSGRLWDEVDGGFFRYALRADWTEPRREKLLESNASLLRAFSLGAAVRGREDWRARAEDIVAWAERTLRRDDGLWSAGQLAEDEYWGLDAAGRRHRAPPPADATLYAATNAYWIRALVDAGTRLGRSDWVRRGAEALPLLLREFDAPDDLLYHFSAPDEPRSGRGLLLDVLEAARACVALAQAAGREAFLTDARRLTGGMQRALWADSGGFYDHVPSDDDVAALRIRERPFEANADAARLLLDLHQATGDRSYRALAERILAAFSPLAARYEIAGAAFALGVEEFFQPPLAVAIVGSPEETAALREAAFRLPEPNLRVWTLAAGGRLDGRGFPASPAPAAYVCGRHGASPAITDPGGFPRAVPAAR